MPSLAEVAVMAGQRLRTTVLGFGAAILVVAALFYVVGVDSLVRELSHADPLLVAAVVVVILAWLTAWSLALRTVLEVLGVEMTPWSAFLVFSGATFSNDVTPFGQAGGEPVAALLISRVTDANYETGLAAIASVDTLNFVPSITLALFGVGYFATETTLGRRLEFAAIVVVSLAIVVPALIYVGWRRRYELEHRVVNGLAPLIRWIMSVLPRLTPPTVESLERRISGFFAAIERIATNRRGLATALAFSALGWFFQMVGLWLAFQAIGMSVKLSIILFIVPIGAIAGVTPLPGGAGGIEWVLATLLALAIGPSVTLETATAAVVIYRGAVYWVPIIIGGSVMSVLTVRERS